MLVIARKRHEAVTIDGAIRVEVLGLTPGVARLRLVVPRGVAIQRGVALPGDPAALEARNGSSDGPGMAAVELTLCGQPIITVRADIHIGLIDVDTTRAVLFVDAPETVRVNVESVHRPPVAGQSRAQPAGEPVQALLPFSAAADAGPSENGQRGPRKSAADAGREKLAPRTIPFPWAGAGEERHE
jgi:sRNA-binding carbon storage regulator CsrA